MNFRKVIHRQRIAAHHLVSRNKFCFGKYRAYSVFKMLKRQCVVVWVKRFLIPFVGKLLGQFECRMADVLVPSIAVAAEVVVVVRPLEVLVHEDHLVDLGPHVGLEDRAQPRHCDPDDDQRRDCARALAKRALKEQPGAAMERACGRADRPGQGKQRGEHGGREADGRQDDAGIEIDVGEQLLFDEIGVVERHFLKLETANDNFQIKAFLPSPV